MRLVMDPVQEWDALICSSTAGRDVVQRLIHDRREQLIDRCGAAHFPGTQLPVIPLPLDDDCFSVADVSKLEAQHHQSSFNRRRGSMAWSSFYGTKADPWPAYQVLQRVAKRLRRPL